jgi:hypothetical protein
MEFNFDFRLLDVSLEIDALDDHFQLISTQIEHLRKIEQSSLEEYRREKKLTPDDPEWDMSRQEFNHKVEFLLPRFFWSPFLVTLYAIYETAVTEIARLIQRSQGNNVAMNDFRGDLLERADKYYKCILEFELCSSNKTWERIKMLAELRNAIVHVNGRIDMLKEKSRNKIQSWKNQNIGISAHYNFLLIDETFAKETFAQVRLSIEDLVERYKKWDTQRSTV